MQQTDEDEVLAINNTFRKTAEKLRFSSADKTKNADLSDHHVSLGKIIGYINRIVPKQVCS